MSKNILYFTRTMGVGGTEKVVLQLCEIMKSESVKIIVCSCGGINVRKLNEMGVKHYNIPDIEKKDFKTIITVLKTVSLIIKEENIGIVHTHHRMAAFYSRIIKFKRNFISINNAHNTFRNKKILTRFALKNVNIIAVGKKVKENLCDFYKIPKSNVSIIHNAIEPFEEKIQPVELLCKYKNEGYFLVGNVGRISEQKGMEYFVESVPIVLRECKNVKFFIIGDGEDKVKIQESISRLNIENHVILLGYRNDIQNVMSQLDLIVLSSLWEGLPITPIEAFSVKKTIVATAVDGTAEIVDDGINGSLVEPKNSKQIAEKVLDIIKNPDKRKSMEKMAYDIYIKEFNYEYLRNKYIEYYKKFQ